MRYRLVVLTHGDPSATLPGAIRSFAAHVSPEPVDAVLVVDGPVDGRYGDVVRYAPSPFSILGSDEAKGFCRATERAWRVAAEPLLDVPYVFYLEHDFEVTRDVDLDALAAVLDDQPRLAQMALMRDAVNEREKAAGGLYESRAGQYDPRWGNPIPGDEWAPEWLEHRAYLTTNPSLMRRDFMAEHPWPADYGSECEGRFGLDLVAAGYTFGVWGAGEPWCEHVGERTGFGY